jgi:hypothetical protein
VGLLIVATACGPRFHAAPVRQAPVAPARTFAVSPVPTGLTVTAVVDGTSAPLFSDDSFGGVHPMLVLVPDDWRGLDDHRWIEVTSIDGSGNEGGFYQELPAYMSIEAGRDGRIEVGGHPAIRWKSERRPETRNRTAGFVAVNTSVGAGGDLNGGDRRGIRVTGPDEDLDLFEAIAASTGTTADRTPTLRAVPDGWRILGTLSTSQALDPDENLISDLPAGRRGVELTGSGSEPVDVHAFPGDATITLLKAIEATWNPYDVDSYRPTRQFEVGGSPAFLVTCCDPPGVPGATATAWFAIDGAPFQVTGPGSRLGTPPLVKAFAAAVHPTTEDEWKQQQAAVPATTTTAQR